MGWEELKTESATQWDLLHNLKVQLISTHTHTRTKWKTASQVIRVKCLRSSAETVQQVEADKKETDADKKSVNVWRRKEKVSARLIPTSHANQKSKLTLPFYLHLSLSSFTSPPVFHLHVILTFTVFIPSFIIIIPLFIPCWCPSDSPRCVFLLFSLLSFLSYFLPSFSFSPPLSPPSLSFVFQSHTSFFTSFSLVPSLCSLFLFLSFSFSFLFLPWSIFHLSLSLQTSFILTL